MVLCSNLNAAAHGDRSTVCPARRTQFNPSDFQISPYIHGGGKMDPCITWRSLEIQFVAVPLSTVIQQPPKPMGLRFEV